jgi:hypothetical protein
MFYKKVPKIFLNWAQVLVGVPLLLLPLSLSLAPSLFSPLAAQPILISSSFFLSLPLSLSSTGRSGGSRRSRPGGSGEPKAGRAARGRVGAGAASGCRRRGAAPARGGSERRRWALAARGGGSDWARRRCWRRAAQKSRRSRADPSSGRSRRQSAACERQQTCEAMAQRKRGGPRSGVRPARCWQAGCAWRAAACTGERRQSGSAGCCWRAREERCARRRRRGARGASALEQALGALGLDGSERQGTGRRHRKSGCAGAEALEQGRRCRGGAAACAGAVLGDW